LKRIAILLSFILTFIFTFASSQTLIVTSIPPLGYAFQQIGGNLVKIEVLTHAGDNPHTYSLNPNQVVMISKATIFGELGLKEDEWIAKKVISINPHVDVVNVASNLQQFLIGEDGNYNPHLWLDVKLYEMMCVNVYYSLSKKFPSYEKYFAENLGKMIEKLEELNSKIKNMLSPFKNKSFVAQHPAWDYFARAYGLGKEYTLENNSGQSITLRDYEKILLAMKKYKIMRIIADPVTPSRMSKNLASQTGAKIIEINPIYVYNYFDLMQDIATKFVEALKGE
jgi:zinc transport system substrate-binding protein